MILERKIESSQQVKPVHETATVTQTTPVNAKGITQIAFIPLTASRPTNCLETSLDKLEIIKAWWHWWASTHLSGQAHTWRELSEQGGEAGSTQHPMEVVSWPCHVLATTTCCLLVCVFSGLVQRRNSDKC